MTTNLHAALFLGLTLGTSGLACAAPGTKIVGGEDVTDATSYPWQVALLTDPARAFDTQFCGGTLINARWILTAAHCATDGEGKAWPRTFVAAGIINLAGDLSLGEVAEVKKWHVHPGYDDISVDNDIALLELKTPLNLEHCGLNCQPIGTVTAATEASLMPEGTAAIITGWGDTLSGYPEVLQYAEIYLSACTGYPAGAITANMFCAGTAGYDKDTCQGDSGGPLVVRGSDGTPYLAGITSWGDGCAAGTPGVYTRVSRYENWISSTQNSRPLSALAGHGGKSGDDDKFLGTLQGGGLLALMLLGLTRLRRRD